MNCDASYWEHSQPHIDNQHERFFSVCARKMFWSQVRWEGINECPSTFPSLCLTQLFNPLLSSIENDFAKRIGFHSPFYFHFSKTEQTAWEKKHWFHLPFTASLIHRWFISKHFKGIISAGDMPSPLCETVVFRKSFKYHAEKHLQSLNTVRCSIRPVI